MSNQNFIMLKYWYCLQILEFTIYHLQNPTFLQFLLTILNFKYLRLPIHFLHFLHCYSPHSIKICLLHQIIFIVFLSFHLNLSVVFSIFVSFFFFLIHLILLMILHYLEINFHVHFRLPHLHNNVFQIPYFCHWLLFFFHIYQILKLFSNLYFSKYSKICYLI